MINTTIKPKHNSFRVVLILLLAYFFQPVAFADEQPDFAALLGKLPSAEFDEKEKIINDLALTEDERVRPVLQALLQGSLFYIKEDEQVVFAEKNASEYAIVSALENKKLGNVSKRKVKKITVNNSIRGQLRSLIAQLSLSNKNPQVRLSAIREMMGDVTADEAAEIRQKMASEPNSDVKSAMQTLIALVDVESEDQELRLQSVKILGESIEPKAYNKIVALLVKDAEGSYLEKTPAIISLAKSAKQKIESRRSMFSLAEKVFFGLSLGSVLLLAAIGLAITFGVMGVINMAHGELIMIGAYTTYVVQLLMPNHIDLSLFVAVPAAFIISGLFGIAIERGVIRFLYGRPLETLLATFGISLVLQQLVRTIFSPLNRSVETPGWMSGTMELNPIFSLTYNRLTIILFSLFVFALLMVILKKTSLGLKVRAVSQNRAMARAMGIRSEWVDALTFGLGSGIAGIAGVALSQLTNVGPNLGQSYIIDSFLVVVFGGVGNLWGTLVGAMSLGVFNKFLEPAAGAVLAKILILLFIILFIQKRPRGLFPQKGRAAEN